VPVGKFASRRGGFHHFRSTGRRGETLAGRTLQMIGLAGGFGMSSGEPWAR